MHEYSLVQSLLDQVESIRLAERADRVVSVHVNIGEFSGVEPDLFREAFEVLIESTPAHDATLDLTTTPLAAECKQCNYRFAVEEFRFECPRCTSPKIFVTEGEDMILETVILEQSEEQASREEDVSAACRPSRQKVQKAR